MARLKDLKEKAPNWITMSLFDCLEMLDISKTNKFVPMLMNLMIEEHNNTVTSLGGEEINGLRKSIIKTFPQSEDKLKLLDDSSLMSLSRLLEATYSFSKFETISEFMDFYENNNFKGLDVNTIKKYDEINSLVSLVNIKSINKEFEKQTHIDLDNETWLVLRPLTVESSNKYGANTKWCTASKHSHSQFFEYTERGILIYCINKKTGYKVAVYIERYRNTPEVSFWNAEDNRIDSLTAEIDFEIFNLIKTILSDSEFKTNKDLGGEYWINSSNLSNDIENKISESDLEPVPVRI